MTDPSSSGAAHPIENVVEQVASAGDGGESVSVADLLRAIGDRSFGPLLLVPGLMVVSPLSGIPGLPTTAAIVIALITIQMLIGMDHVWLPRFILNRSISAKRFAQAVGVLKPVARFADRLLGRRLTILTRGPAVYVIAVVCFLIAATMPLLELLPFASSISAGAISLFGLALTARDGVLAAIAFLVTGAAAYFAIAGLFFS